MSVHMEITLQTIRCIRQSEDDGSEPYIWPFLATMAMDPGTFDTFPTAASLADSRKIVGNSMKAGSSAPLIFPGNWVTHSFMDNQTDCTALLVVAVMEADENRVESMQDGFQAYLDELRVQLGHKMLPMKNATPAERDAMIEEIKEAVKKRVEDAVRKTVGWWEGAWLDADVYYGAAYGLWENLNAGSAGPFTLEIVGVPGNHWEIEGVLNVTEILPNLCQAQIDAVAAAEQAIRSLQLMVRQLHGMLDDVTPQERAILVAAIDRINEDQLPAAEEDLRRAQYALRRCKEIREIIDDHPLEDPPVG